MATYRKLTSEQSVQMAQQIVELEKWQALRNFLNDLYGPDTCIVDIDVAHEKYGDRVQNVWVWTREHRRVLPNLELPVWKDLLAEDEKVFDPGDTEEGRLGSISDYMVQHNVYLDYEIEPVEEENLWIEAGSRGAPPDLYVLVDEKASQEVALLDLGSGYTLRRGYDETAELAFLYGSDGVESVVDGCYWDYKELKDAGNGAPERVLGGLAWAGVPFLNTEAVGNAVLAFLESPPKGVDQGNEEETIIPTLSFEYDLSWYGGSYTKTVGSGEVFIPVTFLEEVEKEIPDEDEVNRVAFERYTGFHRCHLIHWSNEVNEVYSDGKTDHDLQEQEVSLSTWRKDHYQTCVACPGNRSARVIEQ